MCTERFSHLDMVAYGDRSERASIGARLQTSCRARWRPGGCWILADESLGPLPQTPLFWHLVNYPTRAEPEVAKGPRGTVIEAFGKIWLSTIAEAGWQAPSGVHVAEIGPIPGISNEPYTANYSESGNTAGISTAVHRHGLNFFIPWSGNYVWRPLMG
jgi:hypothetical protein